MQAIAAAVAAVGYFLVEKSLQSSHTFWLASFPMYNIGYLVGAGALGIVLLVATHPIAERLSRGSSDDDVA